MLEDEGQDRKVLFHCLRGIFLGFLVHIFLDLNGFDFIHRHLSEVRDQMLLNRGQIGAVVGAAFHIGLFVEL